MDQPRPDDAEAAVRVGIGLVRRGERFLVRRRPAGAALAGLWEFPGGKCEVGESPGEAAVRECREELGVEVVLGRLRRRVSHTYRHARVELYYYDGTTAADDAEPDRGTGFVWVHAADLAGLTFPEANAPIVDDLIREFGGRLPP